jgi:hypothetical protein
VCNYFSQKWTVCTAAYHLGGRRFQINVTASEQLLSFLAGPRAVDFLAFMPEPNYIVFADLRREGVAGLEMEVCDESSSDEKIWPERTFVLHCSRLKASCCVSVCVCVCISVCV